MANAANPSQQKSPTPKELKQVLIDRRRNERRNFLASIESPTIERDCESGEFFQTVLALAVIDYGVSRRKLAAMLQTSEGVISKWVSGTNSPALYARPQVLRFVAAILHEQLKEEALGCERAPIQVAAGAGTRATVDAPPPARLTRRR